MKRQSGRLFRDVHFSLKSLTILEFVDSEKATRSGWLVLFVLSSPPPPLHQDSFLLDFFIKPPQNQSCTVENWLLIF